MQGWKLQCPIQEHCSKLGLQETMFAFSKPISTYSQPEIPQFLVLQQTEIFGAIEAAVKAVQRVLGLSVGDSGSGNLECDCSIEWIKIDRLADGRQD